jgi:hypothetical protein
VQRGSAGGAQLRNAPRRDRVPEVIFHRYGLSMAICAEFERKRDCSFRSAAKPWNRSVGAGGGIRTHGSGELARRVACYSTPASTSAADSIRRYDFLGGAVDFAGTAFGAAAFLGFFFSLLCELLPFPIVVASVRE